jgi:hypothetical protein
METINLRATESRLQILQKVRGYDGLLMVWEFALSAALFPALRMQGHIVMRKAADTVVAQAQ